jgi:ankyrin repeat protein
MTLLLDHGARADEKLDGPICRALANVETVKLLLARGANARATCGDEISPTEPVLVAAANRGSADVVKTLLAVGADPSGGINGWTPLHAVCRADIARILLDAGAKPTAKSSGGTTPLHSMVGCLDAEGAVALLLQRGADVNALDGDGLTPLLRAAIDAKSGKVMALLLAQGARAKDVTQKTITVGAGINGEDGVEATPGSTALDLAVLAGNEQTAPVLARKGVPQKTTVGTQIPGGAD